MGINRRLLTKEIAKQSKPIFAKIKPLMEASFERRKETLLNQFDNDEVTQALSAAALDSSIDDGIVNTAQGGNLYTFIGFNQGDDPAAALRDVLEKDIKLNLSQTKRDVRDTTIVFTTPVRIPTLATIHKKMADLVPIKEWTNRGFTDLIERGVTGFQRYLFDGDRMVKGSRSGHAIQVKGWNIRGNGFRGIEYVSKILRKFRDSITRTRR